MALCAISGEVPREPVVSTKSGHVFEKRLIEQHLATTGTCPVTNQELSTANLIPLQTSKVVKPRPPSATSIPGIIQIMQNEWDSLMLESYTLKKHLDDVRQELAHALYQHDAACRVIARLIKERDAARAALGDTQANMAAVVSSAPAAGAGAGAGAGAAAMSDDAAPGLNKAISAKMEATEKALSAQRKKTVKAAQARVPPKDKIAAFAQITSNTPHSASKPGVTALDVYGSELALTGGADGNAVLTNVQTGKIVDTLKAHKKKVTAVKFGRNGPETAFTASDDGSAVVWKGDGVKFNAAFTAADHKAAVNAVTVHPSGDFFITASADGAWNFYDATAGSLRASVSDEKVAAAGGYTRAAFHPDGLILGTGAADAVVRIFDVRARTVGATVKGHAGPISDLVFSENGFYLASADAKAVVKLWDLRKLDNLCTLSPADVLKGVKAVHALDFDASGTYLAAGTDKDVRVFATSKTWEFVHTYADHSDAVTAVRWGVDANTLFTASLDRTLRVYGSK